LKINSFVQRHKQRQLACEGLTQQSNRTHISTDKPSPEKSNAMEFPSNNLDDGDDGLLLERLSNSSSDDDPIPGRGHCLIHSLGNATASAATTSDEYTLKKEATQQPPPPTNKR